MRARARKSGSVTTKTRNKAIGKMIGKSKAIGKKRPQAGQGAIRRLKGRTAKELKKLGA
jgi:hypothetical protein